MPLNHQRSPSSRPITASEGERKKDRKLANADNKWQGGGVKKKGHSGDALHVEGKRNVKA